MKNITKFRQYLAAVLVVMVTTIVVINSYTCPTYSAAPAEVQSIF